MKRLTGLMALVAFLSFGTMSSFAFAEDEKKDEKKDKGGHVVMFGDEKKEEKTDKGGNVVAYGDDKKDEKKDMGGK